MDEKFCPRCEETKPYNEFYNHKKAKDGLDSKCKICSKEIRNKNRSKHKFNKELHDSNCKAWDEEDTIYLAEYWEH